MSSDHTIRTEVRLSGSIPATFIMGKDLDGIYIGGDFQGEADGFYVENVATDVPDGLWSGGINTGFPADGLWLGGVFVGVVDGYYVANVRTTLADGLWVGEQYQGAVDGWYEDNARETLQDGLWVGEVYQGIADGYYVGNVAATVPDGYWVGGVLGAVPDGYWSGGVPGPVPDGVWDGGVDTGLAQGWYEANKPALVPSGIWNGGNNEGLATGIYRDNIKQTHQFQDVLESLRVQHNPEHWASWALDGSLEEDREQFPLGMAGGYEFVDVGPRKAVKFDGSNAAGLYYGTDEDFAWVHEERVFTVGTWFFPVDGALSTRLLETNGPQSTTTTGFSARVSSTGRGDFDVPNSTGLTRFTANLTIMGARPTLHSWTSDGEVWAFYLNGNFVIGGLVGGSPRTGPSRDPLTIGWQSNATIWNAFATSQVLTDAEIYRLYVAGMNDIQEF